MQLRGRKGPGQLQAWGLGWRRALPTLGHPTLPPSALSPSTGLGLGRTPPSFFPPQPRLQPALEHCEEASDHSLSVPLLSFKYLFKVQKGTRETKPTEGLDTLTLRQKQKNDSEYTSGDERDTEGKQETARR